MIYQRGNANDLASDIGAVGIADQFPFFRAGATSAGNGVQFGLSGAVFAQFDIGTPSYDLLNADYIIALPLSFRFGSFSGRANLSPELSPLGEPKSCCALKHLSARTCHSSRRSCCCSARRFSVARVRRGENRSSTATQPICQGDSLYGGVAA